MDAVLLYSADIWNNDRESNFADAKVVDEGKITESECEDYYPCSLYFEKGAKDDMGFECLNIETETMDFQGDKIKIFKITLKTPDGGIIPMRFPDPRTVDTRTNPLFAIPYGGDTGQAIKFYLDGVETYNKPNREKVKKFLEGKIETLRECDDKSAEEMASEFSVERINPTPVTGKADMKAEAFEAENLAVADVEVWDGMVLPEGTGSIVGQATPETDFTPFGVSAEEGYDDKLDESLGMSEKESKMKQSYKDRRDESKGMKKASGDRAYSRVGTMDRSAENLAVADVDVWDGMVLPEGTGAIVGQATPETDYTPFGVSAEDDVMGNEPDASAIIGQTSDGTPYTPFGFAAHGCGCGMDSCGACESVCGCACLCAESASENLAVADVEIQDGMNIPAGDGAIVGQATPATDFTPFGASAESYMETSFKPDGDGDVIGAITQETDYTPFGAQAEEFYSGYGGMFGLVAAALAGWSFHIWSDNRVNGDDAPDSDTPSEESDDAPQQ
tara:strand:- start:687 stop:2198 length:1512 start_codon:yes stop_codon:yes gene_type:complete